MFRYSWKEARDPMGWLYGAAVLAMQAGLTSAKSGNTILTGSCIASGAVSLLLLLSAMTNRGENPQWKPRRSLEFVVAVLITAILTAGYKAHSVALSGGRQVTESNNGENVPPDASKSATLKLSTIARSLGGSAALGLLVSVLAPEVSLVAGAAVVGLIGGFFAKKLDED